MAGVCASPEKLLALAKYFVILNPRGKFDIECALSDSSFDDLKGSRYAKYQFSIFHHHRYCICYRRSLRSESHFNKDEVSDTSQTDFKAAVDRPGMQARIPLFFIAYRNQSASYPRSPSSQSTSGRLLNNARAPM
jgi:hypothetical protein